MDAKSVVEERIRGFIERYRAKYVYVLFSGGKDSSAALAAAVSCCKDRVVAVYNHIVGNTHRLNTEAALGVARRLGLRIRVLREPTPSRMRLALLRSPPRPGELLYIMSTSYGKPFPEKLSEEGVPLALGRRGRRWCCIEFKEKWWRVLPHNAVHKGKPVRLTISAVKRSDSSYRRNRYTNTEIRNGDTITLLPLIDLTDSDVWGLLREYGIYDVVRKQYEKLGFSPNCMLCPLYTREQLCKMARLEPRWAEKMRKLVEATESRGPVQEKLKKIILAGLYCR